MFDHRSPRVSVLVAMTALIAFLVLVMGPASVAEAAQAPARGLALPDESDQLSTLRALGAVGPAAGSSNTYAGEDLVVAGDLDGDGGDDVLGFATKTYDSGPPDELRFVARAGRDGRELWSYEPINVNSVAYPAKVGPNSADGVVVLTSVFEETKTAQASVIRRGYVVTALSGSGQVLWVRPAVGTAVSTASTYQCVQLPTRMVRLDAVAGAAGDMLFMWRNFGACPLSNAGIYMFEVVDGRTGTVAATSIAPVGVSPLLHDVVAIGDVSGDELDDWALVESDSDSWRWWERYARAVTAFGGATGQQLWHADGLDGFSDDGRTLTNLGDVTGDGRRDLGLAARGPSGHGEPATQLLDGATGEPGWTLEGKARSLGDVDDDGRREVMLNSSPDDGSTVLYTAVNAEGNTLFTTSFSDGFEYDDRRIAVDVGGDVNGDGVNDFVHRVVDDSRYAAREPNDGAVVDGRSGTVLWNTHGGRPLGCSADGDHADIWQAGFASSGERKLRIHDGATGNVVMTAAAGVPTAPHRVQPGDFNGDGRCDLLVSESDHQAVDSRDGLPLWRLPS